jgi:hypothetical protein
VTWEHHLGPSAVTKLMAPERDEPNRGWQRVAHQIGGRLRAQHLTGVGDGHEPSRAVQDRAEVVALALLCDTAVQRHPYPHGTGLVPRHLAQRHVAGDGRLYRRVGIGEDGAQAITHALQHVPAVSRDGLAQHCVMVGHRVAHRVRMLLPQACRALKIREQERDWARRQLAHCTPC